MRILPTKRWWKRLGLGLVILVALALLANGFMAWRTSARLQGKIAAIRAAGDPTLIAELTPKPIPDAENAAAVLKKLGPRLAQFSKEYARFRDTPLGTAYDDRTNRGEAATPEQIAAIRAIVDKYPDIEAGLKSAAGCEKYASLADYSVKSVKLLEEILKQPIGRFRTAERFADWRMEVLVAEGKQDEAVERGLEFLRLARLYDQEPLLVNALVAVAVRSIMADRLYDALAAGPISPKLRAAVDRELALHDESERLVRTLKTERAYSASTIAEFGSGMPVEPSHPILARMFGWVIQRQALGVLDFYDMQLKLSPQPWNEVHKRIGHEGVPDVSSFGTFGDLLLPAIGAFYEAEMRSVATLRALRIFNALRGFADKNGRDAAGLDELSLPKEATIDPFSGEALKLKHTKEGWIVYTVFRNGVDDGGRFIELKDYGVALVALTTDGRA